jgi:DNA-binding XRE family transcriptional regulator
MRVFRGKQRFLETHVNGSAVTVEPRSMQEEGAWEAFSAAALRAVREGKGLTLREAASLSHRRGVGVTPAAISHLEQDNREPQLVTLRSIAVAYNLRILIDERGRVWIGLR